MIIFGIFGIIFLTLGITLYVMSERIQGVSLQYNEKCLIAKAGVESPCKQTIVIDSDIPPPIYAYYQLDNFYQNHRRYVKSRSNEQLMGNWLDVSALDDCDPIKTNGELGRKYSIGSAINGADPKELIPDAPAFPCGLVAKSLFNDTFVLKDQSGNPQVIDSSNIAWKSDVDYKFKNLNQDNWYDVQWTDVEDCKSSFSLF